MTSIKVSFSTGLSNPPVETITLTSAELEDAYQIFHGAEQFDIKNVVSGMIHKNGFAELTFDVQPTSTNRGISLDTKYLDLVLNLVGNFGSSEWSLDLTHEY